MTNLLICDDSSFARKQIVRALPAAWQVEISQASHGGEAMDQLRAGRVDVMVLDLNMPVMDGFEVLEAIHDENISCQVIVVSGDIQPEARERVIGLGALAFLKKPVAADQLTKTLSELGILGVTSGPTRTDETKVELFDSYREIANVAVGRAADLLARYLDVFVEMPIPQVNMVEPSDLMMILQEAKQGGLMSAVCQGFIGAGISGEAMLIIHESNVDDIAALMKYKGELDAVMHRELLLDVSSLFISAAMQGIGEQLDINFSMGHPVMLGEYLKVDNIIERNANYWRDILMMEMQSTIEHHNISCNLLLLFTRESIKPLNNLVSYLAY